MRRRRKIRIKYTKSTDFGGKMKTITLRQLDFPKLPIAKTRFYIRRIKKGQRIRPPVLEKSGRKIRVIDGWHRLNALRRLGIRRAKVELVKA